MSDESSDQDDLQWQRMWTPLHEDVASERPRPLLAHYTNVSSLEGILKNEELWLSHPLYMNDLEEMRFGVLNAVDAVRNSTDLRDALGSDERIHRFNHAFEALFEKFSNEGSFDYYVGCFSEHDEADYDGRLSMWRAYGSNGDGAALVLNVPHEPDDPSPIFLILSHVEYSTRNERVDWLRNKVNQLAALIAATPLDETGLFLAAHAFLERVKLMALFTRHKGFEEEREWRLVYLGERDNRRHLAGMLGYHVGDYGFEPKLKLKVQPLDEVLGKSIQISRMVDRILIGPSIASPLAKSSFVRMLSVNNLAELSEKVHSSTIPLRRRWARV